MERKNKLELLRIQRGLTLTQMGEKLGVSAPTYRDKEQGVSDFRLHEGYAVAKEFGITMEDVLFLSTDYDDITSEGEKD